MSLDIDEHWGHYGVESQSATTVGGGLGPELGNSPLPSVYCFPNGCDRPLLLPVLSFVPWQVVAINITHLFSQPLLLFPIITTLIAILVVSDLSFALTIR